MLKRLISKLIIWLESLTYEPLTVDKVNAKLIVPVHGLMIHGKQLWKYKADLDIPIKRRTALAAANKWLDHNLGQDRLLEYLDRIIQSNNEGNKSMVGSLAYILKDAITNCTDKEALYQMAAAMYFFADEDTSFYDADIANVKVEAFRNYPDQDFFLTTLLKHMGVSSDTSIASMQASLKSSAVKLQAYDRFLRSMRAENPDTASGSPAT